MVTRKTHFRRLVLLQRVELTIIIIILCNNHNYLGEWLGEEVGKFTSHCVHVFHSNSKDCCETLRFMGRAEEGGYTLLERIITRTPGSCSCLLFVSTPLFACFSWAWCEYQNCSGFLLLT